MQDVKLGRVIKFLSTNLEKNANKELKTFDLSLTQGIVLKWLNDEENHTLTIKEIEKRAGTAQSTIFGVICRLENKGLVETFLIEHKKVVKITAQGMGLCAVLESAIDKTHSIFFKNFTEGERKLFVELLQKAESNFL